MNKAPQITFRFLLEYTEKAPGITPKLLSFSHFEGPSEGNLTVILSFNLRKAPQNCAFEVIFKVILGAFSGAFSKSEWILRGLIPLGNALLKLFYHGNPLTMIAERKKEAHFLGGRKDNGTPHHIKCNIFSHP